jgi:hypothetical protein
MKRPTSEDFRFDYEDGSWEYDHKLYIAALNNYIDDYLEAQKKGWISVDDEIAPKDGTTILAMNYNDKYEEPIMWVASIWYDDDEEYWNCDFKDDPFTPKGYHSFTHWMPLPLPPKTQDK